MAARRPGSLMASHPRHPEVSACIHDVFSEHVLDPAGVWRPCVRTQFWPGERSCPCNEGSSTFSTRALYSHGWLFCECPDGAKLCGPHGACPRHHSMPPGAQPRPVHRPALLPQSFVSEPGWPGLPGRARQVCPTEEANHGAAVGIYLRGHTTCEAGLLWA